MATCEPTIDAQGERAARRPLIAHIVFRFDYGGLENGIVNIVNGLPAHEFDHAIIALTQASEFSSRIRRPDVRIYPLNKQPGKDWGAYLRLWKLLRQIRPAIVHTRNVGTLDCQLVAWLAGVPVRIHGEHGWDVHDPDGLNPKYLRVRRLFDPFVHRFVTVSRDLQEWLVQRVGIRGSKVTQICNGVDTQRFGQPANAARQRLPEEHFPPGCCVIGSVTRLSEIKDPLSLVRAWLGVRATLAAEGPDVRLALIGDGPLRGAIETEIAAAGASGCAWLAGSRDDVADLLRALDIFVLSSRREGISNTVLEAMATGLPVIASATGGNLELIENGVTGMLTPPGDSDGLAQALLSYVKDPAKRAAHGAAARRRAERMYSLSGMMNRYRELYGMQRDKVLEAA